MFVMHVIDQSNRFRYADVLEDYWRIRHDIYVKMLRWPGLSPKDGREIDQFDTNQTTYLIGLDAQGRVVGGSRFNPTLAPHLLGDIFSHLVTGEVPRGAHILEWTRVFVVPQRLGSCTTIPAGIVYCAIVEFCLAKGISHLSVVCEPHWQARLDLVGWRPERLGPVVCHEGCDIVALRLEMTPEALKRTRARYGVVTALNMAH